MVVSLKLSAKSIVELPDIPSASGVEMLSGRMYIVGDDGQFLYVCDRNGKYLTAYAIFDGPYQRGEKIPKKVKPDFEATFVYPSPKKGNDRMVILGSGSKSNGNRDVGYIVKFDHNREISAPCRRIDLSDLYAELRNIVIESESDALNIEGAVLTKDYIVLLHRRNGGSANRVILYERNSFIAWLCDDSGKSSPEPVAVYSVSLPKIEGCEYGLSGATLLGDGNTIFACASAEVTDDAVNDGAILGSVGLVMHLPAPLQLEDCTPSLSDPVSFMMEDGSSFGGKIESVAITGELGPGLYEVIAVTDNDGGGSQLIFAEMNSGEWQRQ